MKRLLPFLAAVILTGFVGFSTAAPAQAASDGLTETATTAYQLVPDKGTVHVVITIKLKNSKPNSVGAWQPCSVGLCRTTTKYYFNSTSVLVDSGAGPVSAKSDAGAVRQSTADKGRYYNLVKLTFPNVYYGQTRTVTVSFDIHGGTARSSSTVRAGKAYASFCMVGNGRDGGTVTAAMPSGYKVNFTAGPDLNGQPSGSNTIYSSGSLTSPYDFWSCLEATNAAALARQSVVADSVTFDVRAWPEDTQWSASVSKDVGTDIPRLESLYGLPLPAGPITVQEAASSQLGGYDGIYEPGQRTATVSEEADPATVAHELSHIWFNQTLFDGKWLDEGFAGFSEQAAGPGNYEACKEPGRYPGTGSPKLSDWLILDAQATQQDENVSLYQYDAACWIVTSVANSIGPERLRDVVMAASRGQIAYVGSGAPETPNAGRAIDAKRWLDLVDELGMVPAGQKDLDAGQKLLAQYGILTDAQLAGRSGARASYHELASKAGAWKLPFAVRGPMASWQFDDADAAMKTASAIVAARDAIETSVPQASLDGSSFQQRFESAENGQALEALLKDTQALADAAVKVKDASGAVDQPRDMLQSIGLLGTDVRAPISRAVDAVKKGDAAAASSAADEATAALGSASNTGTMRVVAVGVGLALLLLLLIVLVAWRVRRGRRRTMALAGAPGMTGWTGWPAQYPGSELYQPAAATPTDAGPGAPKTSYPAATDSATAPGWEPPAAANPASNPAESPEPAPPESAGAQPPPPPQPPAPAE